MIRKIRRHQDHASIRVQVDNSSSSKRSQNASHHHSRTPLIVTVSVAILLVTSLWFWWATVVLDPPPGTTMPRPQKETFYQKWLPWDSSPPPSTPLFATENPVLHRRHDCLVQIRKKQLVTIKSLLLDKNKDIHSHTPPMDILLVDPAYHANVGDHMITLGEQNLIRQLWNTTTTGNGGQTMPTTMLSARYQECHYVQAGEFVPRCERVLQNGSNITTGLPKLALWHGGGNWGDVWPSVHKARIQQSVRQLLQHNFSIVGMPQSWWYKESTVAKYDARLLQREIRMGLSNKNSDATAKMTLLWRDRFSYAKAQALYPFVSHHIMPDMAFQLGPYNSQPTTGNDEHKVDLVFLLRRDKESTLLPPPVEDGDDNGDDDQNVEEDSHDNRSKETGTPLQTPFAILQGKVATAMAQVAPSRTYRVLDWSDRRDITGDTDPFFSKSALEVLSLGHVVICDRLHAAILAFLMGKPFLFIEPTTRKISNTLQLAMEECPADDRFSGYETLQLLWYQQGQNLMDAIVQAQKLLHLSSSARSSS